MASGGAFFEMARRSVERSRASQKIRAAVRSGAQGKTRDEARQLLIDELRSRGQELPAQPWLDAWLDGILANDGRSDQVKTSVEVINSVGKMGLKMFKRYQDRSREGPGAAGVKGLRNFPIPWDKRQSVEVALDHDAQDWIGALNEEMLLKFRQVGALTLELSLAADGSVVVNVGDRRAGMLPEVGAEAFRPLFSWLSNDDHPLRVHGTRYQSPEGHWHLYINMPKERFSRLVGLDIEMDEDLPPEAFRKLFEEPLPPTPSGHLRYDRQKRRWVDGSDLA
jgi:hypothetical protein